MFIQGLLWIDPQMHGIESLPNLYLRSNDGLHVMISPIQTQHMTSCLYTTGSCILFMFQFNSAMMPFTEFQACFQPWPELFCCFTERAGHHENTLNLTLILNKSSGKCLV